VHCFSLKSHSILVHQELILIFGTWQPAVTQLAFDWKGGGERNRTNAHSLPHSLGSSIVCWSESQAQPDLIWYKDTSQMRQPESSEEMGIGWEKTLICPNRKTRRAGKVVYVRFYIGIISKKIRLFHISDLWLLLDMSMK
jgi:hypothetical protein